MRQGKMLQHICRRCQEPMHPGEYTKGRRVPDAPSGNIYGIFWSCPLCGYICWVRCMRIDQAATKTALAPRLRTGGVP